MYLVDTNTWRWKIINRKDDKEEIFLSKKVLENPNISNEGLAVYTALRYMMSTNIYLGVSYNLISYWLYKSASSRKRLGFIKNGLSNLIENELISVVFSIGTDMVLDVSNLMFQTKKSKNNENSGDYFIKIYLSEIRSILTINKNISKFSLLKYFIVLIGTINNSDNILFPFAKNKVGSFTIRYLAEKSDISENTINRPGGYNSILEDMKLIYIHRSHDYLKFSDTGEIRTFSNVYGRYDDKDIILEYAKKLGVTYGESHKKSYTFKNNSNKLRSISARYNAFIKGKSYTQAELQQLYEDCIFYNEDTKKYAEYHKMKYGIMPDDGSMKIKDLSVFTDKLKQEGKNES